MKHILPAAALLALASCTSRPENAYTVTVETADSDGATYYLSYENGDSMVIDSAKVENGKVSFAGKVDGTRHAVMTINDRKPLNGHDCLRFYLEPADISINAADTGNFSEATVTGAPTQDAVNALNAEISEVENQLSVLFDSVEIDELMDKNSPRRQELDSINNIIVEMRADYIRNNPASLFSLDMISPDDYYFNPELRMELYNQLSDDLKAQMPDLQERIQREIDMMPGKPAPELTGTDPVTGKDFRLSDRKGSPVLIDFWATWCGPCRASLPHISEIYDRYAKKGLIVLLVSCDRNVNAWTAYIREHGLDKMINIHEYSVIPANEDGDVEAGDSDYSQASGYGVSGLPAKFLIDADGNIIGRFFGDDDLDAKLAEIFR